MDMQKKYILQAFYTKLAFSLCCETISLELAIFNHFSLTSSSFLFAVELHFKKKFGPLF